MKKLRLLALTLLLTIITLPMLTAALPIINPELDTAAEASPNLFTLSLNYYAVLNDTEYTFEVTITKGAGEPTIEYINITTPANWSYISDVPPSGWSKIKTIDEGYGNYTYCYSGSLSSGSATFLFTLRTFTNYTKTPGTGRIGNWTVWCSAPTGPKEETKKASTFIDVAAPAAEWSPPVYTGVGAGNRVWLNVTVYDDCNATGTAALNITGFALIHRRYVGTTGTPFSGYANYTWVYCLANTTDIDDGPLNVSITIYDAVGNSTQIEDNTYIDITEPEVDLLVKVYIPDEYVWIEIYPTDYTIGIPSTATRIQVKAIIHDHTIDYGNSSLIMYEDTTVATISSGTWNNSWMPPGGRPIPDPFPTVYKLEVNVTDDADPYGNNFVHNWTLTQDTEPPTLISVDFKWYSGGVALKNFDASDNIGVYGYCIYINETRAATVSNETLYTTTWTGTPAYTFTIDGRHGEMYTFSGCLIINLTDWGGTNVNITVTATDGSQESTNSITDIEFLVRGRIFPIPLYPGWNLISFPLVPRDKDTKDILADGLLLYGEDATPPGEGQGALIDIIYGYDDDWSGDWSSWIPSDTTDRKGSGSLTTMEDGRSYWVSVKEGLHDVLIIEGDILLPPSDGIPVPPVYEVDPKWNLAGYKSILRRRMFEYLQALPDASENNTMIFTWDPEEQNYIMLSPEDYFPGPGYGFWLFWPESEDAYYTPPTP